MAFSKPSLPVGKKGKGDGDSKSNGKPVTVNGGKKPIPDQEQRSNQVIYFDKDVSFALSELNVDPNKGLLDSEAEERLKQYGPNELSGGDGVKWWAVLLSNILNPMNAVLSLTVVASAVVIATGNPENWAEAIVITLVIITNTIIGYIQEYRSEMTMAALRKLSTPTARVMRDGQIKIIQSRNVVPGDVLYVEDGDQVAADIRFIEVVNLSIDEALLTGESLPVKKQTNIIEGDPAYIQVGDRVNMAFKQTTVTRGRGSGVVVSTGLSTEIGAIAKSLMEGSVSQRTPLERGMIRMMYVLLVISVILGITIFGLNNFEFEVSILVYVIAVAVAILPEGLPAVVTVTMSFGVRRMAKQKAVVRRLVSLENLGSATNICSDKTGTLTQGKMMARQAWVGKRRFQMFGKATAQKAHTMWVRDSDQGVTICGGGKDPNLDGYTLFETLLTVCALCHSSSLTQNTAGEWVATGDPTELALVILALRFRKIKQELQGPNKPYTFVAEAPFDSAVKRMTSVSRTHDGSLMCFAKGAVEGILSRSIGYYEADGTIVEGFTDTYRDQIETTMRRMASEGLRVLAFGIRDTSREKLSDEEVRRIEEGDRDEIEKNFVFIGLVGLQDPPRKETEGAVARAQGAGIVVHMATGDHPLTARSIARQVGIIDGHKRHAVSSKANATAATTTGGDEEGELTEPRWDDQWGLKDSEEDDDPNDTRVMIAAKFDQMTDEEVDNMRQLPLVLARCSPQSKVKLIRALHRKGKRVVMTGDGVNDAPAVKNADVGISMGEGGSDVTRQASDITLTDDNFATIAAAVEEGRRIFANITKFALHLLSGNVSEVIALVFGLAVRDLEGKFIFPMSPVQILYLNLLTSSPVALALGVELGSKDIMRIVPRNYGVFHFELVMDTLVYGAILGALSLGSYILSVTWVAGRSFDEFEGCNETFKDGCQTIFDARAVGFYALSLGILAHGFVCRHNRRSTFRQSLKGSKFLVQAIILGVVLIVPTSYIPFINTTVFKQGSVSGIGWAFVFVCLVIHMTLSEIYKFLKRTFMKSAVLAPADPMGSMK